MAITPLRNITAYYREVRVIQSLESLYPPKQLIVHNRVYHLYKDSVYIDTLHYTVVLLHTYPFITVQGECINNIYFLVNFQDMVFFPWWTS